MSLKEEGSRRTLIRHQTGIRQIRLGGAFGEALCIWREKYAMQINKATEHKNPAVQPTVSSALSKSPSRRGRLGQI
jgi:hypothetical protein